MDAQDVKTLTDTTGDGVLDFAEIVAPLQSQDANVGKSEAAALMQLLDTDGNGSIELDEMIHNSVAMGECVFLVYSPP